MSFKKSNTLLNFMTVFIKPWFQTVPSPLSMMNITTCCYAHDCKMYEKLLSRVTKQTKESTEQTPERISITKQEFTITKTNLHASTACSTEGPTT